MKGNVRVKVLLITLVIVATALCVASVHSDTSSAANITVGKLKYSTDDVAKTATITGSIMIDSDLELPSKIKYNDIEYDVTAIGNNAFLNSEFIKTLTLADGIVTIGNNAFDGCGNLTDAYIPPSVKTIEDRAFQNSGLKNLTLSEGLKTIGEFSFFNSKITALVLPASVTTVGKDSFNSAPIKTLSITDGCHDMVIAESAFNSCPIENLTIPSGVSEIYKHAFRNNSSLKTLYVTPDVTNFCVHDNKWYYYGTFDTCTNLTAATVHEAKAGDHLKYIFNNCNSLTDLTLFVDSTLSANGIINTFFGDHANWAKITKIDSPTTQRVENIVLKSTSTISGQSAACIQLLKTKPSITGSTITDVDGTVYKYSGSTWNVVSSSPYAVTFNYNGDNGVHVVKMTNESGKIAGMPIPTRLGYTFAGWFNGSQECNTESAFDANTQLNSRWTADTVSYTVKYIGPRGETIKDPTTGTGTFDTTASIAYPTIAGKTAAGSTASLVLNANDRILVLYYNNTGEIDSDEFLYNDVWYKIIGPGKVEVIPSKGTAYTGNIKIPEQAIKDGVSYNVVSIGTVAFDSTTITGVTLPYGLEKISKGAFRYCTGLTDITIPPTVKLIEGPLDQNREPQGYYGAFYGCSNLRTVNLVPGVREIGSNTFMYCRNLESIVIPGSVTKIGINSFKCTGIKTLVIDDDGVTKKDIYESAFNHCLSLTSAVVPACVEKIHIHAFRECANLESISIATSVTDVDCGDTPYGTFEGCNKLKSVTMPNAAIRVKTFWNCAALDDLTLLVTPSNYNGNAINTLKLSDGWTTITNSSGQLINNVVLKPADGYVGIADSGIRALSKPVADSTLTESNGDRYRFDGTSWVMITGAPYLITFDLNGKGPSYSKVTNGSGSISMTAASCTGYNFIGWYDAETEGNKYVTTSTFGNNTTVFAHWTAETNVTYKIKRLNMDGTVFNPETTVDSQTFGSTVIVRAPAYPGYTPDNNSVNLLLDSYSKTATFYYKPTLYTKTVNNGSGASPATSDIGLTYLSSAVTSFSVPVRAGYTFNGYVNGNGDILVDNAGALVDVVGYVNGGKWIHTSDTFTLTAKWTPVTYVLKVNDGTTTTNLNVTFDDTSVSLTAPSMGGYTFDGFYAGGVKIINADLTFVSGTTAYTANGKWNHTDNDITLTAGWNVIYVSTPEPEPKPEPETPTKAPVITYNANGGYFTGGVTFVEGYSKVKLDQIPVREGFIFLGWSKDPGANLPEYRPGDIISADDIMSLYSVWIPTVVDKSADSQINKELNLLIVFVSLVLIVSLLWKCSKNRHGDLV